MLIHWNTAESPLVASRVLYGQLALHACLSRPPCTVEAFEPGCERLSLISSRTVYESADRTFHMRLDTPVVHPRQPVQEIWKDIVFPVLR